MSSEEQKPVKKEQYVDIEQLYKLAAQSSNVHLNVISHSNVVFHSEQNIAINIETLIQKVENTSLTVTSKTEIIRCIQEVKEQVETKAPWEKIVEKILLLLGFGREALPVVADLLQWLMKNLPS